MRAMVEEGGVSGSECVSGCDCVVRCVLGGL